MLNPSHPKSGYCEDGSFRDPAGRLFIVDGRVLRVVNKTGAVDLNAFLNSRVGHSLSESGSIVPTELVNPAAAQLLLGNSAAKEVLADEGVLIEHERVPFRSFPYEWPPEMLHAAGALTLDLAEELLKGGFGLKDATPYNVLFRGPKPVFVDLLSFERRDRHDPIWLPYAQFVRTFLLPLLVNKYFSVSLDQTLAGRRDGLEPEDVYRLSGPIQRLIPPFLTLATIPTWLAARHNQDDQSIYRRKSWDSPDKAKFFLQSLFKRLRRTLDKLRPPEKQESRWSDYLESNNNYSQANLDAKNSFVEQAIAELAPRDVLDVGCNTGHFSAVAARGGARVVAIDYDPVVVGRTWRLARREALDIQPLVVNLTRPSPAIGWRNRECPAFLERARGSFDAVFMLAVLHHMLVTERVPLAEIIDLAAELTTDALVIEFIAPEDSMFRRIARGRDHLFVDLSTAFFETTCLRHFDIVRRRNLPGTSRWLYLLRKR
jgi:SAM-dependent methyltransferase